MIRYLSYPIHEAIPVYGRVDAAIELIPVRSLRRGDSCNVYKIVMENHWGTHVDCPAHFFDEGRSITDYPPETWIFNRPFTKEIVAMDNLILTPGHIGDIPSGTDLLLIKSGFYTLRGTERYSMNNPGFAPETGVWLRKTYPLLKAIGFDFVSLSPFQDRVLGGESHKALLDPEGINSPIRIIEDMDLSHDLSGLTKVWISPLRIERLDSAPCTVVGFFND